jgi:hypothetical protein
MPVVDAARFRREVRRLSSRFLSQRLTHAVFLAEVRKSAIACGLAEVRRPTRDDRLLDALAWGTGSVNPGELPSRLEPLFDSHEKGDLADAELASAVQSLLAQVRKPTAS